MQPHYSQGARAHCKPRETPSRTRQALGLLAHGPASPPVSTRRGPGHPGQPVGPGVKATVRAGLAHPACLWPQGTIPLISMSPGCSFGCCFHLLVVFRFVFFCVSCCPACALGGRFVVLPLGFFSDAFVDEELVGCWFGQTLHLLGTGCIF